MKLSNAPVSNDANARKRTPPPISLQRPDKVELQKGEYLSLKLQSTPGVENSQTYELSVPFFGSGTPEQWLKFRRDLDRVLTGQNLTTGPSKYAMARRLLDGDALAKFNERALFHGNETSEHFNAVMQDVTEHVFPKKALLYQKRYMRRFMRKPKEMSTRLYVARVNELNEYLKRFPPFANAQEIPQDEMMDIFEYSIPVSWQKQAIMQGFDVVSHTPSEFVEFCERLETVEDGDGTTKTSNTTKKEEPKVQHKGKRKYEGSTNTKANSSGKTCLLHGPGHSTDECRTIQHQAKRMKATYQAATPEGKKAWKKREETNALVAEVIEALNKKKGSERKRKNTPELQALDFTNMRVSSDSDASTSSDEE